MAQPCSLSSLLPDWIPGADLRHGSIVENSLNRNSIGDRTPGLKLGADGALEIYIQNEKPGADKASYCLPAPAGPHFFVARMYGPKDPVLKGTWKLPRLTETK